MQIRSKRTANVLLKCRAVNKPLQGSNCTYLETYWTKLVEVEITDVVEL